MQDSHYASLFEHERTNWWYRVRRSMIKYFITSRGEKDSRILDVGCGTGFLMTELASLGEVTGVDPSERALDFCRQRGITDVHRGSLEALPCADNQYDFVLALDVLEHVDDDAGAIRELERVTRPGGTIIIFVPAFQFLWGRTDILSEHKRRYTKAEMVARVEAAGLTVDRATYFNSLLFLPILAVRWFVRLAGITVDNENNMSPGFVNNILYVVFYFESLLGRYINYPFGVSIAVIARKI